MVFVGGWRSRRRRRRYGPYDEGYGPTNNPYGPGYPPRYRRGFGGGSSCLRDMFLLEGGCCIAELLGCGPGLVLLTPALTRRRPAAAPDVRPGRGSADVTLRDRPLRSALKLIDRYQREVSPLRPPCCRFTPTCSHYAGEALQTHGLRRGLWLTTKRLVRCRPGAVGGSDPVPGSLVV